MGRNFREMIEERWSRGSFVCVGLDSEFEKIPESAHVSGLDKTFDSAGEDVSITRTIIAFNRSIVEATKDLVCAYKPNIAFYESWGAEGLWALQQTVVDIRTIASNVPVILDAKRADIDNTNNGYIKMAFDYLGVDAITVHPYLGHQALKPFLNRQDKGIFVLCRTSNKGAGEFQDIPIQTDWAPEGTMPLYQYVAMKVAKDWSGNCGLVVGATYPDEMRVVRNIVDDMPILIPGIGAQGGDLEKTVQAGRDKHRKGMIINSSRGIIFASNGPNFAEAARRETEKLRDSIDRYRHL